MQRYRIPAFSLLRGVWAVLGTAESRQVQKQIAHRCVVSHHPYILFITIRDSLGSTLTSRPTASVCILPQFSDDGADQTSSLQWADLFPSPSQITLGVLAGKGDQSSGTGGDERFLMSLVTTPSTGLSAAVLKANIPSDE